MTRTLALAALLTLPLPALTPADVDMDRDNLSDRLEQQLIDRFQPRLHISTSDCASRPSAFTPNITTPMPAGLDGTIYARAFPVERPDVPGAWVEVQYFHIWAQDCGWNGHPLDVEHVSTLLRADSPDAPADAWEARYWFAAAHLDTICDASHGARAESIDATKRGAAVWVARGKHASYLARGRCRWGCGSDRCPDPVAIAPAAVINLGERTAPLNGSAWVAWSGWPLGRKMQSDFGPEVIARLDKTMPGQIVAVHNVTAALETFLLSTGTAARGLIMSQQGTRAALGAAGRVVGRAAIATGRAIIAPKLPPSR
jgi:hypothetical protein